MPEAELNKLLVDKRHTEAVKDTLLRRKAAQLIRDTAVDKEPEAKEEPAEAKEEAAE